MMKKILLISLAHNYQKKISIPRKKSFKRLPTKNFNPNLEFKQQNLLIENLSMFFLKYVFTMKKESFISTGSN